MFLFLILYAMRVFVKTLPGFLTLEKVKNFDDYISIDI